MFRENTPLPLEPDKIDTVEEAQVVKGSLRESAEKLGKIASNCSKLLDENKNPLFSPDKLKEFEAIARDIEAVQKDLDNNLISDAQQKLMTVKGQLKALLTPGKSNADVEQALASLSSITITDVGSAKQAEGVLTSSAQLANAESGAELQNALGGVVLGAVAIVNTAVDMGSKMFGSLLDKDTLTNIKKWNPTGLLSDNLSGSTLLTEEIKSGIQQMAGGMLNKNKSLNSIS